MVEGAEQGGPLTRCWKHSIPWSGCWWRWMHSVCEIHGPEPCCFCMPFLHVSSISIKKKKQQTLKPSTCLIILLCTLVQTYGEEAANCTRFSAWQHVLCWFSIIFKNHTQSLWQWPRLLDHEGELKLQLLSLSSSPHGIGRKHVILLKNKKGRQQWARYFEIWYLGKQNTDYIGWMEKKKASRHLYQRGKVWMQSKVAPEESQIGSHGSQRTEWSEGSLWGDTGKNGEWPSE